VLEPVAVLRPRLLAALLAAWQASQKTSVSDIPELLVGLYHAQGTKHFIAKHRTTTLLKHGLYP